MYTVIIAEQEHFERFREYQLFVRPFIKETQIAFCRWISGEKTLKKSVPDLEKTVTQQQEWRALILCGEGGLTRQNPFEMVSYQEPVRDENESLRDYYARRIVAKEHAYDLAAKEPLVQLVTRLSKDPLVRKKKNATAFAEGSIDGSSEESIQNKEELEYREYRQCLLYKQKLRQEIRGEEQVSFSLPTEIYCIAMRQCEDPEYILNNAWSPKDESNYSRFYDWNLYSDKMRYLVFDIVGKQKESYRSEYIRFMISILLLAGNEIPRDCLRPNRVYTLQCDLDENHLTQLINRYYGKLEVTKEALVLQVDELQALKPKQLSDEEVERSFNANINISIDFQEIGNQDDLCCKAHFGLSGDCPVDNEGKVWADSYSKNKQAVRNLTRQSSRTVREAVAKFHTMNAVTDDETPVLSEYQAEDVKEYVDREEKEMIDASSFTAFDVRHFYDKMDIGQQNVLDIMETRMRKKSIIFVSVLCLVMMSLGLIPLYSMNQFEAFFNFPLPATVVLGMLTLIIVIVAVLICLFYFRGKLRKQVAFYNKTMKSIASDIEKETGEYAVYLSHAANVVRGNSLLKQYNDQNSHETQQIMILQKHIRDLEVQQAELKDIFGKFLNWNLHDREKSEEKELPYDYDFNRAVDYEFPMPLAPDLETKIEFLESGNYAKIPYGIVKSVKLRREELYD